MATINKKKSIKMRLVDYWKDDTEENFYDNWLIQLLQQKYDIIYSDSPDVIVYSCYGMRHLQYDCVRIAFCLENMRIDWNLADYGIEIATFMDLGERYMRIPYFCIAKNELRAPNSHTDIFDYDFAKRNLNKRDKFCSYMVSNGGAVLRESFFDKLSEYKRVDSGGKWRNNIGGLLDEQYDNKQDDMLAVKQKWLENYKFNICFENSSYPGYLTEKLFDAYNAGCIPIYWGDTSLKVGLESAKNSMGGGNYTYNPHDLDSIDMRIPRISPHLLEYKINPKAFINAHNFPNLDALVEEVKRIDNDDKAYNAMRNEPLFLDNFNPKVFYKKKIFEFFDNIFSQSPNLAFRRGEGQRMEWYRNLLPNKDNIEIIEKFRKYKDLTGDSLKIAQRFSYIQKSTRKFRHRLKFWKR